MIDLADYDFALPPEQIAQQPPADRDGGRLLALDRVSGQRRHLTIRHLPQELRDGDLVVVNATRVLPARLRGEKDTGGRVDALLLGHGSSHGKFRALVKFRGKQRVGQKLFFLRADQRGEAEIVALEEGGVVELAFNGMQDPYVLGETPLPPYIERQAPERLDEERYQTTFGYVPGSVAAPTAGLHLTEALLEALDAGGVRRAEVVLHVGLGTFRAVGPSEIAARTLHAERFELPQATADAIDETRARGGRVVAIGTTTARVLETCADETRTVRAQSGETRLFLQPGDPFHAIDALLTNFHLPRSSLLLLVCAFAGRKPVLAAYEEAVREDYRFFSYGDAMWIA